MDNAPTDYINRMQPLKQMKATCTTYKNKQYELTRKEGELYMGDVHLRGIKHKYFLPCSLSVGEAHLVFVFDTAPQDDGKTTYFFRRNWLTKPINKSDDDELVVDELNDAMKEIAGDPDVLSDGFEGRVDGTYEQSVVHIRDNSIIAPAAKLYRTFDSVECFFFERITSYTRSFDLTLVTGEKTFTISTIQRKKYLQTIQNLLKGQQVYETGPDPIPWDAMFKKKKTDQLTWKQLHAIINDQESEEEVSSDWAPGQTEEEEESDDDYDYPEEESEDSIADSASDSDEEDSDYERPTKRSKQ